MVKNQLQRPVILICSVFVRFREPYVDTLLDLKQFFKWYMIRFVVEGMDIESDTCVMGLDYVLTM